MPFRTVEEAYGMVDTNPCMLPEQEAMYQPIGLECGHRFCADCAFTSAGKGNALGTVRAILDHVDPDAPCPECRTKGVFALAMELKETEKLIKQRCEPLPPPFCHHQIVPGRGLVTHF
jgi:hypothetical protein